ASASAKIALEPMPIRPAGADMFVSANTSVAPLSLPARKAPEPTPARPVASDMSGSPYTNVKPASHQAAVAQLPVHAPSQSDVQQMLSTLNNSLYPEERERAASQLGSVDWRAQPQVVQVLVTAARKDSAATVRASCVRSLAKMHVNTAPVLDTLQALRGD